MVALLEKINSSLAKLSMKDETSTDTTSNTSET
jgi:lambda repressor-like predicted transcriptional regulator